MAYMRIGRSGAKSQSRFHVGSTGCVGFPGSDLADLHISVIENPAEGLVNVPGDVFGRGVHALERRQVIQEGVIQFLDEPGRDLFDVFEVDEEAVLSQLPARNMHFDFPVVTMKILTPALVITQPVRCSHVCDNLEFVQRESPLISRGRSCVRFAALAAFSVNDDAGAGTVRAENPVFGIK